MNIPNLVLTVVLLVVATVASVLLWYWLDLVPPDRVRMAAGHPGSGYHAIAERYRAILAEDGITLDIVGSDGSVENARLLAAGEVGLALVQGGVPVVPASEAEIEAVAVIELEPLLLFTRNRLGSFPPAWDGVRLAVGPEGSGTRHAWDMLTSAMDLPAGAVAERPIGGQTAADALLDGEIDAAVFVAPLDAPYLEPLFAAADVRLSPIGNASGLARRLRAFLLTDLPAGVIDYRDRVPAESLALLAAPLRLAGREDLHPALVNRLVRAAQRLHGPPNLLRMEGTFPTTTGAGMPVNPTAASLLEEPPTAFEQMVPYWVSAQINRFALLLLPVLFILVPLFRALPGMYDWLLRRRIYRQYRELIAIHMEAGRTRNEDERQRLATRLDNVEASLSNLKVPIRYRESTYLALNHVDLVRRKIALRSTADDRPRSGE